MRKILFAAIAVFVLFSCAVTGVVAQEEPMDKVKVRFTPRSLNLGSEGNWVTCKIKRLPQGYSPADIDLDTVCIVEVNGNVLEDDGGPLCFDKNSGAPYTICKRKLMVSFDREVLADIITANPRPRRNPSKAKIIVEGSGLDGELQFWGRDKIKIKPAKNK